MAKVRCYVGNVPYTTTEEDIRAFFAPYKLRDVYIIMDRETQRPRGFAFIEPKNPADASTIIATYNGRQLGNRTVTVSIAHDKPNAGNGNGGDRRRSSSHVDRGEKNGSGNRRGRDRYSDDY